LVVVGVVGPVAEPDVNRSPYILAERDENPSASSRTSILHKRSRRTTRRAGRDPRSILDYKARTREVSAAIYELLIYIERRGLVPEVRAAIRERRQKGSKAEE
jgi:hypothetical protein